MKKIIFLLFVVLLAFSSCENIEENTPVIQAQVDSLFFKSFDAVGNRSTDGAVTLVGLTDNEAITLHLSDFELGSYNLGENSVNYATYEDSNGRVYLTNPSGQGKINVTDRCISCGYLSGNFKFTAILPGIDTVYVDRGIFFEVPFIAGEDTNNPNAGSLSAILDGAPFNTVTVGAVDSGNSLLISGIDAANKSIIIRVPVDVAVGVYTIPTNGFQLSVALGAITENATFGELSIIAHDTTAKTISGVFSFMTNSNEVTEGQFNVAY